MNEKFFALPEEKQQRIINAGYDVFSKNSYKKSPVGEIAIEIQKSYASLIKDISAIFMPKLNPDAFRPGLDMEMIFKTMYWTH